MNPSQHRSDDITQAPLHAAPDLGTTPIPPRPPKKTRETRYPPLPPGVYLAKTVNGSFVTSSKGTKGLCIKFEIVSGEHRERLIWKRYWCSDAALRFCRRDITDLKLSLPDSSHVPALRVRLHVSNKENANGVTFNDIGHIDVIGPDPSAIAFDGKRPPPAEPADCRPFEE